MARPCSKIGPRKRSTSDLYGIISVFDPVFF